MKKILSAVMALLIASFALIGCGKIDQSPTTALKDVQFETTTFTVPKDPQRVAVLSTSLLMMVHELGVTPVGRTVSMDPLPPDLESIQTVGHTAHVNTETLLGLQPDLVLGLPNQQKAILPLLTENKIPFMMVDFDGINQNEALLIALGKVFNKEKEAEKAVAHYQMEVHRVKSAVKDVKPARVAVLFATGKAITAETSRATASAMCDELGMINVVTPHMTEAMQKAKSIPYSLEMLSMDDPDIIFVVTMGKRSEINKKLAETMTDNPAWNQLSAVKNNKVYYLPSNLFLVNPGINTPKAMAELVYDAYGITVDMP